MSDHPSTPRLYLSDTVELTLTLGELQQLQQALIYSSDGPSQELSHRIQELITDGSVSRHSEVDGKFTYKPGPDYVRELLEEIESFYSQDLSQKITLLIPSEFEPAVKRSLGRAKRGAYDNAKANRNSKWRLHIIPQIDKKLCGALLKRVKGIEPRGPSLPQEMLGESAAAARPDSQADAAELIAAVS